MSPAVVTFMAVAATVAVVAVTLLFAVIALEEREQEGPPPR